MSREREKETKQNWQFQRRPAQKSCHTHAPQERGKEIKKACHKMRIKVRMSTRHVENKQARHVKQWERMRINFFK